MINYQEFTNNTTMVLTQDGYWRATTSITQKLGDESGIRTRKIATVGIDKKEDSAFNTAIKALERYFESCHKDLFDPRNELEDEHIDTPTT